MQAIISVRCYVCCVSAQTNAAMGLTQTETIVPHCPLAGSCLDATAVSHMVGSPIARRVSRHRRRASHFAQQLMRALSPTCETDVRADRYRRRRDQRRKMKALLLRELKDFFGVPRQHRNR